MADEDEKEGTGATFFSFEWLLFEQIANALKDCGLANSHHDISLSRGASWVRSKCGRGGSALGQQALHFDYDTTAVGFDRLQLPMSLFVYFQATNLHIIDTEQNFDAGDILLLLGDCPHAGSRWTATKNELPVVLLPPNKKLLATLGQWLPSSGDRCLDVLPGFGYCKSRRFA